MTTAPRLQAIEPTPSAYAYPLLIKQLLHTPLACSPTQEIIYRDLRRQSYQEFRRRIGRLAGALGALGIAPGEPVAVMDWDSHRYLEAYFAIPMMGAVLMTVNVRLSPDQIAYTLNHCGARALLVNRDFLPLLDELAPRLDGAGLRILLCDDAPGTIPSGFAGEYEALLEAAPADFDFPDFDENAAATMFYTTGTTGAPKGVCFSHRQLVLHTLAVAGAMGSSPVHGRLHRDDVYMPITPMFHVHAWGVPYVATMLGLRQVYPGRYTPDGLLELIRRERVSFSHCVPTILQMLLACPSRQASDLRGWKVVIGGSALPRGLACQAREAGIDVIAGYGMSETCPILTVAHPKSGLAQDPEGDVALRTRTGLPIPLVDLRVVDGEMRDLPHDGRSAGEVVVRAPWLTQAYPGNPAASEALWAGGYLHTGDIGAIDPEGYLQVTDRIKDVIKTGGEWVSSLAIEDLISRHPAVADVAVIGVRDPTWGERPLAVVVPRGEAGVVDTGTIQALVRSHAERGEISKYAVPERVQVVEAIDRTSVGKIDKKRLRARFDPD